MCAPFENTEGGFGRWSFALVYLLWRYSETASVVDQSLRGNRGWVPEKCIVVEEVAFVHIFWRLPRVVLQSLNCTRRVCVCALGCWPRWVRLWKVYSCFFAAPYTLSLSPMLCGIERTDSRLQFFGGRVTRVSCYVGGRARTLGSCSLLKLRTFKITNTDYL